MSKSDEDAAIAENVRFTFDLATKILDSSGEDLQQAFTKAVGRLAQVIFITTIDERREETIGAAMNSLRHYLALLDEVGGTGATEA